MAEAVTMVLLVAFPQITLVLPNLMFAKYSDYEYLG